MEQFGIFSGHDLKCPALRQLSLLAHCQKPTYSIRGEPEFKGDVQIKMDSVKAGGEPNLNVGVRPGQGIHDLHGFRFMI